MTHPPGSSPAGIEPRLDRRGRDAPGTARPIQVLLAARDGERHLPDLLDSLAAQTCPDFTVLARDDGSTDRTREILAAWGEAHPGRLELLAGDPSGSASANFALLLEASTAPYVMCCDQDDVWLPDKVARSRQAVRRLEDVVGAAVPLLVHSDLAVVDAELRPLSPSFWRYQHLHPATAHRLNRLLMQNVVTGCTTLANRALLQTALPVPPEAIMHDWWLALCACAFGRIAELATPTVRYRQHGANDTGAKAWTAGYVFGKAMRFCDRTELATSMRRVARQAAAFHRRFADRLAPEQRRTAAALARIERLDPVARRVLLLRHRLFKIGAVRNLGMLCRI